MWIQPHSYMCVHVYVHIQPRSYTCTYTTVMYMCVHVMYMCMCVITFWDFFFECQESSHNNLMCLYPPSSLPLLLPPPPSPSASLTLPSCWCHRDPTNSQILLDHSEGEETTSAKTNTSVLILTPVMILIPNSWYFNPITHVSQLQLILILTLLVLTLTLLVPILTLLVLILTLLVLILTLLVLILTHTSFADSTIVTSAQKFEIDNEMVFPKYPSDGLPMKPIL